METNSPPKANTQKRAKIYFIVGYVLLVVMALFWSVDASLVYIFFGCGVFFLFLGFYNWPRQHAQNPSDPAKKESPDKRSSLSDIFNARSDKPKTFYSKAHPKTSTSSPQANRRLATWVVLAVFAAFIVFFIGSILSASGDLDDASFYYQAAEQHYWNGSYDSASMNYRQALRLNAEYPEAMVGYGNVLSVRNQQDSAIIMYDKALEINPAFKEASYNKALMHYNLAKYNESIEVLKPVFENNPEYYDAALLIGDDYYAQNQYDDAIGWYEKAYNDGGVRSRNLCHVMAYIYDTKGNYAQAIELYKEALTYDSTVVEIHKRLGELLPNEEGNYYRTQAVKLQQQ